MFVPYHGEYESMLGSLLTSEVDHLRALQPHDTLTSPLIRHRYSKQKPDRKHLSNATDLDYDPTLN